MSLTTDRKPVEVRVRWKGRWRWVRAYRYVIHRGRIAGWLTFLDVNRDERTVTPGNWRKVDRES